ncbi:hypothetical protein B0T10DRAFT_490532 [Thelonectria olida]|uniref:Azaphilone pigments biosynthesis cluster protein L N-terminal domain-containing protein n=1 Tax=Thelonectria olida TaxID=1576542 RepID=A0A9P9ANI6_9HYPO|nr:hypothetical protein B0T10DRAFT_490532 [Thelonectria olida]
MEAIGAGASTLAFVLLALKSAKVIHESLSSIKDAPRSLRELTQDIQLLQSVLGRLTHCSLNHAPSSTVVSLQGMLKTCTTELSSIEARLSQFSTKANGSRSSRILRGALAYVKEKDLEDARSRIRDKTTQANLYLGLLQAQAISDTSSRIDTQASATSGILEQILGEMTRLHERLDHKDASPTRPQDGSLQADPDNAAGAVADDLEAMTLCSELEQSISRLSTLVDCDGLTLDADDAERIIDDLRNFIVIAKDKVSVKHNGTGREPAAAYNTTKEDARLEQRDLKLIEGLILSAPIIAINQAVPSSKQFLACLPSEAVIKQKRVREQINLDHGYLTISTNKRRRICQTSKPDSSGNMSTYRDVVANIMFRPSTSPWMFAVSVSQGQLFDRSMQSIPRISICPILPNDSPVFRLVQGGQLDELRILLDERKASLRDHDEQGMPLLHYAATGSVEMCKFLIESGADVDEMAEHSGTALSRIAGLNRHDTTQVLLENMADPTLSYPGWDNPLSTACSVDIPSVELFLKHGRHFAMNDFESSDMNGRTRLHQICMAESRSTSKRKAVAMLVAAGAKMTARILRSWSPEDHQTLGFTCLHSLVYTAHRMEDRDDLETLVYLIQHNADISALDHHESTVSMRAYLPNQHDNYYSSLGSYRGDLWDAALAICGYDIGEFRKSYPRVPRYNKRYRREDFERLWLGNESRCPYWDDRRYPETGGTDDYWTQPVQRCGHTSCPECEEPRIDHNSPEPKPVKHDETPAYSRYNQSPSPSPPYDEPLEFDGMDEGLSDEEQSYELFEDAFTREAEEFSGQIEDEPSPQRSEDGEAAYRRLAGSQVNKEDCDYDEFSGQVEVNPSPPPSEDGEAAYQRLVSPEIGITGCDDEGFDYWLDHYYLGSEDDEAAYATL